MDTKIQMPSPYGIYTLSKGNYLSWLQLSLDNRREQIYILTEKCKCFQMTEK